MVACQSLADVLSDLQRVEASFRSGSLEALGNHTAGALLGHLAVSMDGSFDGIAALERAVPWWLRLVGPLAKRRVLGTALRPGVRMSNRAEQALWDEDLAFEAGIEKLRKAIARLDHPDAKPTAPHPVFGRLTPAEWKTFHLRHCELHMSFLRP